MPNTSPIRRFVILQLVMATMHTRPGLLKQMLNTEVLKARLIHSFYYLNINLLSVAYLVPDTGLGAVDTG